jgi:hypothetical protein
MNKPVSIVAAGFSVLGALIVAVSWCVARSAEAWEPEADEPERVAVTPLQFGVFGVSIVCVGFLLISWALNDPSQNRK